MSFITKALTVTALTAAIASTAGAAPVKRVPHFSEEGTVLPKKVIPENPSEETWTDIGKGILRDDVITYTYIVDFYEFPVRIQESDQQPGRYRLVNAWAEYPLLSNIYPSGLTWPEDEVRYIIVDATDPDHVFIQDGYMGCYMGPAVYSDEGYQEGVLWSMAGDYLTDNLNGFTVDEFDNIAGKLRDGAITFPKGSILYQPWEPSMVDELGRPERTLWITVNKSGMFRLKLPDAPDVDVNIELLGLSSDRNTVDYELKLQDDIKTLRVALVAGEEVEEAVKKIKDGSIEYQEITGDGRYSFPYTADGLYTLVCVPYTEDGVARYESYDTHTFDYDESEWKKMGTARHTEAIISDNEMRNNGFILSSDTYDVPVEMSTANNQLFRLVNPYGPPYAYATDQNYDNTRNYYMEFDASDADRVYLKKTEDFIGIDLGYGSLMVWSRAGRLIENEGMTLDEVNEWEAENKDPVFGWIDDNNVLHFPKNALLLNFSFVRPDTWYWSNREGGFSLVLPSEMKFANRTGAKAIESTDYDFPTEYFTLDGVKVSGENLAPGIYVVRKGDKVWKQTVK